MSAFAVCSSLYEGGRDFLDPFVDGLLEAVSRTNNSDSVETIFAIDDLEMPSLALSRLAERLPVVIEPAALGATPTDVRNVMFRLARASRADILVFVDMDDVLLPDALNQHRSALQSGEISYGELQIVNRNGLPTGSLFFEGANVPSVVFTPDAIVERNFFGLSNTAVRKESLTENASTVPGHLVATDWWMFTKMLSEGRTAKRTAQAVVQYRQHAQNILGNKTDLDITSILKRCTIIREHYAALERTEKRQTADEKIARLVQQLRKRPEQLTTEITLACNGASVWYDDIFRLAALAENR